MTMVKIQEAIIESYKMYDTEKEIQMYQNSVKLNKTTF